MSDRLDLLVPVSPGDHVLGPPSAAVELVEYGDYECPDCLNSEPIVRRLRETFGDSLRVVFRHFPQYSVHPRASAAAQAAEAAAAQGKFWEIHHALFAKQQELADLDFTHLALQLGMDPYKFESNSGSARIARHVSDDHETGARSGVKRTPTFFINGHRHDGPIDLDTLADRVRMELACR